MFTNRFNFKANFITFVFAKENKKKTFSPHKTSRKIPKLLSKKI